MNAMAREKQAEKLISDIMAATADNDSRRGVALMTRLETGFSDTLNFIVNGAGCLIETGDISSDLGMIRRGRALGEKALTDSRVPKDYQGMLRFNVGNGYYAEFKADHKSGEDIDYYAYESLQCAKQHYRHALASDSLSEHVEKQARVNLANVYDSIGRSVEAIHLYEEVLCHDGSFAMAKANLGYALYCFSGICGEYRGATLVQAYHLIADALKDQEQIRQIGGTGAISYFQGQLEMISGLFPDRSVLSQHFEHPVMDVHRLTRFEQAYYRFCFENKLFLNFHVHTSDVLCRAAVLDNIMISLVERPRAQSRFFGLCKYVNQMKEDYAAARYLLFQSMQRRPYMDRISRLTTYVDTLDCVNNNLYVGLQKAAFDRAYSVLDKIGMFLDAYLELKTKGRIYFTTIWAQKRDGKWVVNEQIKEQKHLALLGLFDVNRDFRSGEYADIVNMRNALMHDHLCIVEPPCPDVRTGEAGELRISVEDFTKRTVGLMRIVKSCVSNLINFVNSEEQKKVAKSGVVLPMFYFNQDQGLRV
jgi:tetratricopeptide (TPR) repeat protein